MQYYKEIDGIRAIAVISVILFHFGFKFFSGGYVGVDIFFVISGFLITSIILKEKQNNNFSILDFYERRARRIMPALFIVILASIIIALTSLSLFELKNFLQSVVATFLFVSNIFFSNNNSYFGNTNEIKPLLHTWSLAIEEQYYLIFPVFVILTWKLGKKTTVSSLLIISLISLFYTHFAITKNPKLFFLIQARCFELIIGSILAFISQQKKDHFRNCIYSNVLSLIGLLMILFVIARYKATTPFPSLFSLIPIFGTVLLILFANESTIVGKILSHKILTSIGLISYSLYLWHQPVIAFARIKFLNLDSYNILLMMFVIFFCSLLSWKYIEQPFRNKNKFSRKFILVFTGSFIAFFILLNSLLILLVNQLLKNGIQERELSEALIKDNIIFAINEMDERKFINYRIENENFNPEIIVFGSSRMMQLGEKTLGKKVINLSVSGSAVEDYVAIIGKSIEKFNPKKIFIGVDPWTINGYQSKSWHSIANEYYNSLLKFNSNEYALSKITNISDIKNTYKPNYLSLIFYNIFKKINSYKIIPLNDQPQNYRSKIRRDGTRIYDTNYLSKYQLIKDQDIIKDYDFNRWLKETSGYNCINSVNDKLEFENFLNFLKKNYKIILVLPPYHPLQYQQALINQSKCLGCSKSEYLESEIELRKLALKHNIEIIGSFDPKKNNCEFNDFIDWIHPKESCMKKILKKPQITYITKLNIVS